MRPSARDEETGAAIGGEGELRFEGGVRDLELDSTPRVRPRHIEGEKGEIEVPGYLFLDRDNSARIMVAEAGAAQRTERILVRQAGLGVMFEDMAAAAAASAVRAGWADRTRRRRVDAIWPVGRRRDRRRMMSGGGWLERAGLDVIERALSVVGARNLRGPDPDQRGPPRWVTVIAAPGVTTGARCRCMRCRCGARFG